MFPQPKEALSCQVHLTVPAVLARATPLALTLFQPPPATSLVGEGLHRTATSSSEPETQA